jgi:hypothetical protein
MRDEFGGRFPYRALAKLDHPLQAGFLDRPYKPFGVGVWLLYAMSVAKPFLKQVLLPSSPFRKPLKPAPNGAGAFLSIRVRFSNREKMQPTT